MRTITSLAELRKIPNIIDLRCFIDGQPCTIVRVTGLCVHVYWLELGYDRYTYFFNMDYRYKFEIPETIEEETMWALS